MSPRTAALPQTSSPKPDAFSEPPAGLGNAVHAAPRGRTGRGPARWAPGAAGGGGDRCRRGSRAHPGGHVAVGRAVERGAGGEGLPAADLGRGVQRKGDARRPRRSSAASGGLPGRRHLRPPAPVARRFAGGPARLSPRGGWLEAPDPGPPCAPGRRSEAAGGTRRLGEAGPALGKRWGERRIMAGGGESPPRPHLRT